MSGVFPTPYGGIGPLTHAQSLSTPWGSLGINRLPTDPLFYADMTLKGIVIGSTYRITRNDNGDELASGADTATADIALTGIPCFANPMLVDIDVRKGDAAPYYRDSPSQVELGRTPVNAFIFQIPE